MMSVRPPHYVSKSPKNSEQTRSHFPSGKKQKKKRGGTKEKEKREGTKQNGKTPRLSST